MRLLLITSRAPLRPALYAALVVLATCESSDNFAVNLAGEAVIPQRSIIDEPLGELSVTGLEAFDIAASPEFVDQGYGAGDIDSVRVVSVTLAVDAPVAAELDFIDAIVISVATDDLPAVDVARLDPVPADATSIELEVLADVELAPYVTSASLVVTTQASGVRPPVETTLASEVAFDVHTISGGLGCD